MSKYYVKGPFALPYDILGYDFLPLRKKIYGKGKSRVFFKIACQNIILWVDLPKKTTFFFFVVGLGFFFEIFYVHTCAHDFRSSCVSWLMVRLFYGSFEVRTQGQSSEFNDNTRKIYVHTYVHTPHTAHMCALWKKKQSLFLCAHPCAHGWIWCLPVDSAIVLWFIWAKDTGAIIRIRWQYEENLCAHMCTHVHTCAH